MDTDCVIIRTSEKKLCCIASTAEKEHPDFLKKVKTLCRDAQAEYPPEYQLIDTQRDGLDFLLKICCQPQAFIWAGPYGASAYKRSEPLVNAFIGTLKDREKTHRISDVGAGTGVVSLVMMQKLACHFETTPPATPIEWNLLEIRPQSVCSLHCLQELIHRTYPTYFKVNVFQHDATAPFPAEVRAQTIVMGLQFLHYVYKRDWPRVMRNISNALADGGRALFNVSHHPEAMDPFAFSHVEFSGISNGVEANIVVPLAEIFDTPLKRAFRKKADFSPLIPIDDGGKPGVTYPITDTNRPRAEELISWTSQFLSLLSSSGGVDSQTVRVLSAGAFHPTKITCREYMFSTLSLRKAFYQTACNFDCSEAAMETIVEGTPVLIHDLVLNTISAKTGPVNVAFTKNESIRTERIRKRHETLLTTLERGVGKDEHRDIFQFMMRLHFVPFTQEACDALEAFVNTSPARGDTLALHLQRK